jgi:hypothetical protein
MPSALDFVPSRRGRGGEAGRMALRRLLEGGALLLFGAMTVGSVAAPMASNRPS